MTFEVRKQKLQKYHSMCRLFKDLNFYLLSNLDEVIRTKKTSSLVPSSELMQNFNTSNPHFYEIDNMFVHASSPPNILKYINFKDRSTIGSMYGKDFTYHNGIEEISNGVLKFRHSGFFGDFSLQIYEEIHQDEYLPKALDLWEDEHYVYFKLKYYNGNENDII